MLIECVNEDLLHIDETLSDTERLFSIEDNIYPQEPEIEDLGLAQDLMGTNNLYQNKIDQLEYLTEELMNLDETLESYENARS